MPVVPQPMTVNYLKIPFSKPGNVLQTPLVKSQPVSVQKNHFAMLAVEILMNVELMPLMIAPILPLLAVSQIHLLAQTPLVLTHVTEVPLLLYQLLVSGPKMEQAEMVSPHG